MQRYRKWSSTASGSARALLQPLLLAGLLHVSAASSALAAEPYRVAPGDTVSIAVYGQEDLSGQFSVFEDGAISYPIIGSLAVEGMTTTEISSAVGSRLSEYIPGLSVSTAVSQYAPIFLLGDVQKAGRYEYRPGMIVLELLALGGGVQRLPTIAETSRLQLITTRAEYDELVLELHAVLVNRVRLQAEFDGADFDPAAADDPEPNLRALKQSITDREHSVFKIRRDTAVVEDKALAEQERSYAEESRTIRESIQLHDEEIALLSEDVASTRVLVERGLTAKSNLREAERRLSATGRVSLELGSFLARAEQNQLSLAQRRLALAEARKNEAAALLPNVELMIGRKESHMRALLETMAELATSGQNRSVASENSLEFSILRRGEEGEIKVDERTTIMPGDILQVAMPRAPTQRQASLQ